MRPMGLRGGVSVSVSCVGISSRVPLPFAGLARASRVSRLGSSPPVAADRLAGTRDGAAELPAARWRGRALAGVGGSALECFHSP